MKWAETPVEEFISIWQKAKTFSEVYDACGDGATRNALASYAKYLRDRGVPLKKMKRGPIGPRADYSALAELAERLNEESQ